MRGLALNAIGFMIIAIASVGVLLLLFSGPIASATRGVFCGAYGSLLPKADLPFFCREGSACGSIQPKAIDASDRKDQSRQIAAHIISCFVDKPTLCREIGNLSACYVLRISPMGTGEKEITEVIHEENGCLDIKNSEIWDGSGMVPYADCGSRDDIAWEAQPDQQVLIISYDAESGRVKVT